jgi:AraC-like DNA-binding protein
MLINAAERATAAQPIRLRVGTHSMVLRYAPGHRRRRHAHPAWEIVVPQAGWVEWHSDESAVSRTAGVVFPPQLPHLAHSPHGHVSVFIDPWYLGLGPGDRRAIALDAFTVKKLRALTLSREDGDPDNVARDAVALLRRNDLLSNAISIDSRVTAAVHALTAAHRMDQAASAVGLSSSRFRALLHQQTGTPPAGLRSWQRFRVAIQGFPVKPIAQAAVDAGFADQAHLTRTANRLMGQTPGRLLRDLRDATTVRAPDNTSRPHARRGSALRNAHLADEHGTDRAA